MSAIWTTYKRFFVEYIAQKKLSCCLLIVYFHLGLQLRYSAFGNCIFHPAITGYSIYIYSAFHMQNSWNHPMYDWLLVFKARQESMWNIITLPLFFIQVWWDMWLDNNYFSNISSLENLFKIFICARRKYCLARAFEIKFPFQISIQLDHCNFGIFVPLSLLSFLLYLNFRFLIY